MDGDVIAAERLEAPCVIRAATVADAETIARHRAAMFRDMGFLDATTYAPMRDATRAYLERAIPAGEYHGWLAAAPDAPGAVVAGAGLQLRPMLPALRRRDGDIVVVTGVQGYVVNVYVEREWRRRGLARQLMTQVLATARALGVAQLGLHASAEGRPLYEALGFVPTSDMRYAGAL